MHAPVKRFFRDFCFETCLGKIPYVLFCAFHCVAKRIIFSFSLLYRVSLFCFLQTQSRVRETNKPLEVCVDKSTNTKIIQLKMFFFAVGVFLVVVWFMVIFTVVVFVVVFFCGHLCSICLCPGCIIGFVCIWIIWVIAVFVFVFAVTNLCLTPPGKLQLPLKKQDFFVSPF